jgi:hypothetical protein
MVKSQMREYCKPLVLAIVDSGVLISIEFYDALFTVLPGLNSYDRYLLRPLFNRALLIREAESCLKNCSTNMRMPPSTYDECMLHELVPLMLKELEKK